MQVSFTLPRNDLWLPNKKINKVYSLAKLSKFFGKEKAIHFHPFIKKALLCSNSEFWYSNYPSMFSAILNFFFFNIFLRYYIMTNSEEVRICIRHILLMNIPNLISFVSYLLIFIHKSKQIQREMSHYLNYFVPNTLRLQSKRVNKEDELYTIGFKKNYELNISQQIPSKALILNDNNCFRSNQYFEYVINIPSNSFRVYHYETLFEKKEKDIIREIMVYLHNKDFKWKKERLQFLFTLFFWLILLYFQKESITMLVVYPYCILIITLYYMFEVKHLVLNNALLKNFIGDMNTQIIKEGYFIGISDYLISLFAIKKSCEFNLHEAKKEAELIRLLF